MKNIFYLFVLVLIYSCNQSTNMGGFFYNTGDMNLKRGNILIKDDSLIVQSFNVNTSNSDKVNSVYLRALKDDKNRLTGSFMNGFPFKGHLVILKNGIKIYSFDSTFICEFFKDSSEYSKYSSGFTQKRVNYYNSLLDSKKVEYISNITLETDMKITVHPSVNQSLSSIPSGSKFLPFVDYTTLNQLSVDRRGVDVFLTHIFDIIKKETPLVIRVSERPLSINGNRFEDGGLSRRDIGKTYHYGNYSYNFLRQEFQIYYLDILNNSLIETGIGYIIDNSNGQSNRDGQLIPYSFYSQREIQTNPWKGIFERINEKLSDSKLELSSSKSIDKVDGPYQTIFTGSINEDVNAFFKSIKTFNGRLNVPINSRDTLSLYKVDSDNESGTNIILRIKNNNDFVYGIFYYSNSNQELPKFIFDNNSTGYSDKFPKSNIGYLSWDDTKRNLVFNYDFIKLDNDERVTGRVKISFITTK
jgi:hypothetical protein